MNLPAGRNRPPSRYGRAPMSAASRRRVVIALGALAVLAGLGVATLAFFRYERVPVEGELAAYQILDDRTVEVTIRVTRTNPDTPVVCIVRARSKDGSETGRREVLIGPSAESTVQITTQVKSYARPFVGDVYGCGTEVPGYLMAP